MLHDVVALLVWTALAAASELFAFATPVKARSTQHTTASVCFACSAPVSTLCSTSETMRWLH